MTSVNRTIKIDIDVNLEPRRPELGQKRYNMTKTDCDDGYYQAEQDQEQQQQYQERQLRPRQAAYDESSSGAADSAGEAYTRLRQQQPRLPQPSTSANMPAFIQEILKFQAQMPYDSVSNQISYDRIQPYVPEPAEYVASQQPQPGYPTPGPAPGNRRPVYANTPGLGQYSTVAPELQ
ncbi:hypothetical protein QAD02_010472 [Eretmocerus hayati]|uniref:Uncharacterized protein n=1 Tax=Eretmocerus hayati TaxID=131215 RepID=A0ACC2NV84_9HYME|nr:hypothetical protein QAD02_010472 [Eretmocerus hayati]